MDDTQHLQKAVKLQPSEEASLLSRLFFCWAPPLFYRTYRKTTPEEYYVPLESHRSENLGDRLENAWESESLGSPNPSLWHALWKTFRWEFLALGLIFAFSEFVLKLSQPWLIGQLLNHYNNATTVSKEESYFYGSLIALTNFLSIIVSHFYQLNIQHLGMKIRIACCSVIYRKVLKIDRRVLAEWNIGRMVNLVTNDVNRFDLAAMHLVQSIVASIESIFVIYCLYETGGTTTIAGIFLLIFFIPVQIYMGRLTTWFRQKTATRTDRRIKLTNEIVSGIEVIKSFTWEELFTKRIAEARKLEVRQILKTSMIRAMNVSFMLFMNRSGVFLCILAYVLTHGEINAKYVFVISSFYAILRQTLTVYLPFGIQNFSETKVSIERIRNFLMVDETFSNQATKEVVTYIPNEKESLLKNPSDTKEEPKPPGVQMENVSIKWTSSPVLTNINFEASLNELVIITGPVGSGKSTLLHTILNELPLTQGALHVRGTISYTSQEPWLFPGTIRQNILFGSKFDQDKYRRVVSVCQLHEDFLALADGDGTWIGESGALLSGGQKSRVGLARSVYKEADVYLLDDPLSAVDAKVAKRIFQECFIGYLRNKCTILVTHNTNYINGSIDRIYVTEGGTMRKDLTYEKEEYIENDDKQDKVRVEVVPKAKQVSEREGGNRGIISREVYRKYIQAGGNSLLRMVLCLLFISAQVAASGADYFVAFWVNNKIDNNTAIGIYAAIIMAIIAVSIARSLIFFKYSMQASINLHGHMFTTIVRASMDFFRTTTTGTILNRFSKDLGIIDETLAAVIMDTIQVALIVLGSTSLIIILNPWMVLPTLAIFTLFYFFKTMFLALSRNLKRFEATARSPIYSHVHSSVQGLSIIRAFNAQTALRKEFDHYQDLHSSAFYMFLTCNRAFGFWLDMNCVFYTGAVITTVMLLETLAGDVGLSITQSINLIGVLQWGIRQWSELENQMISVERVVEYTKIPPEDEKIVEEEIPNEWPISGQIIFKSVTLQYFNNPHLALNDINLRIQPNEKIGIVGRTGAGKSSLISALFRLFKFKGKILIDNIDVGEVPLNVLRSKLSIIPQEPILFNGTLRHNLDPHHEHEDHVLYAVIEQVELKTLGLDHEIAERGSNLSVGQKQLVCLARAILRNNRILIMDEATASVDLRTDFLIQKTIKENFRNCTVLTVAHRLGTVLESDRVLVMDHGRIVEFDRVERLLRNPESLFSQLVRESGK